MRKECGSIVEPISKTPIVKTLFGEIVSKISLKPFAEETEGDNSDENGGEESKPTPTINYEDLIAKARREEKEKQYKTIEKLKGQIDTLTKQHNDDLIAKADLEKKLEDAKKKLAETNGDESEAVKTLKKEVSTLKKEKEDLEKKVSELEKVTPVNREDIEKEVRAELEAEYEVRTYKAEKLAELKDEILVPELVFGNTKEDIDASIENALNRSKQIRESLGGGKKEKRTPKSPTNPSMSGVQDKQYSLEYLASLNPASKEYAEVRKQLGLY